MAISALDLIKRVCVSVGINSNITAFSETDETLKILQMVNESAEEFIMALPSETPYLNQTGTLTTVASQRTYTPPSNFFGAAIAEFSIENETNNDEKLEWVTLDNLRRTDSKYDETLGRPQALYMDGSNLAVYPVPDDAYTINYAYSLTTFTRLTAITDTLPLPDRWAYVIEKKAVAKYKDDKGYSDAEKAERLANDLEAEAIVDAWEMNPTYWGVYG